MSVAVMMVLFWLGFSRFDVQRDEIIRRKWRASGSYMPPRKK